MVMPLLLLLLLPLTLSLNVPQSDKGLYKSEDQVLILDATNFYSSLEGRQHAWMVEFYAHWCGYCQNLAPTFSQLAREVAPWADVLRVAVIDCGDEVNNQEVCSLHGLDGFPTIKFFPPNVTRTSSGGLEGVNAPKDHHGKEEMKADTMDFLADLISTLEEEDPSSRWPRLDSLALNSSSLGVADLWPRGGEDTFLVLEREGSYIGREVILSTWRRSSPHPVVGRLEVEGEEEVLARLGVTGLPALLLLDSQEQSVTGLQVQPEGGQVAGLLRAIRDEAAQAALRDSASFRRTPAGPGGGRGEGGDGQGGGSGDWETTEGVAVEGGEVRRRRYSVYLSDLEKTVVFALLQEVAVAEQPDLAALSDFLDVLLQYFPRQSSLLPLLKDIREGLNTTSLQSLDTSSSLTSLLAPLSTLPSREWVGCRGSLPQYGGYPCGLWQLWHTLIVAQGETLTLGERPGRVLNSMVSYVRNFFTCRECVNHFLEMMKNGTAVDEQVTSPSEASLFLWAAHNAVNLRLQGAASDDPAFPKSTFPSTDYCPDCWDTQGSPVEASLLAFLTSLYSPSSLLDHPIPETEFSSTSSGPQLLLHSLLGIISLLVL